MDWFRRNNADTNMDTPLSRQSAFRASTVALSKIKLLTWGDEFNDEDTDILILPHGAYELNIQQYIYELIVLAVPIKRIHPGVKDGTLNSDILKKLEELSPKVDLEKEVKEDEIDPRWNTLKKLLTDK